MSSPNLRIEPFTVQDRFIRSDERFAAFIGGIGSGKSWAGAVRLLRLCLEQPGLYMVVAPTYPMLRDATFRSVQTVCGDVLRDFRASEFICRIGKSEVLFRSADQPDRLRGPNLSGAWMDEGAMCPKGTWEIIIGRLREGGRAGPCWVTTTPKGRNWLYERQPEMTIYRTRTQDNPYLSPDFVRSLEASYTGKFARQELEGEFVGFEGLVYEEFDRGVHVHNGEHTFVKVIAGVDEGYTNPAVILVLGIDGDGRAFVVEEFYQRRRLQGEVVAEAQRLQAQYHIEAFFADPSAAGLIADMRKAGLPVKPARNEVYPGIQAVKARLAVQGDGHTRLAIAPSCANTISEFESYCWKESRQGIKDEPEKVNDHAMDALRYATVSMTRQARSAVSFQG